MSSSTDCSRVSLAIDMSMRLLRLAENLKSPSWEPTHEDFIRISEAIGILNRLTVSKKQDKWTARMRTREAIVGGKYSP